MDERAFELAQEREEGARAAAIANRTRYEGVSLTHCVDCDEPIPDKRREAIRGVECCVDCQSIRETRR